MSSWLERSLASLPHEMRDWPEWKRDAASSDPHLGLQIPLAELFRTRTKRVIPIGLGVDIRTALIENRYDDVRAIRFRITQARKLAEST